MRRAVDACPKNLAWKVFLAGARMECAFGRPDSARSLASLAYREAPEKSRSTVYVEMSRIEFHAGEGETGEE